MSAAFMQLKGVSAAVLALTLAACSSMAPDYQRPVAPVASRFPDPNGSTANATAATAIEWRQFFTDERLKQLVTLALANNRDLRLAVLNIEQARAQYDIRHADQTPTVNAGVAWTRQPPTATTLASLYTAGLLVTSYELDLFGRVRSLSDTALAQYLATEDARKSVQISLVAAVATSYLALQGDEELLRVTQQTLQTREASQRLIKLRFDNGASSQIDLRQAESLLESARVALALATRQRALDENALVLLLGQALPTDLATGLPITAPATLPELAAGLPSDLLARRPDIRQAEQQLIAANANIGAARAAFFPKITLTASLGSASTQLGDLFKAGSTAWSFAPQLLQPIFDGGRNQANLKVAEVGRDIATAQYERAIQSAFREVADALAGRATLGEQLRAQEALVRAEQDRYRLAELRYRNGVASYLDALDAQRSLFAAQQALVQTQVQYQQNLVTLYRVLGGGWSTDGPAN